MSDDSKNKLLSRQEELMYGFQFSKEDLEANREGHITEHQKSTMLRRERYQWMQSYVLAGGFVFFGLLYFLTGLLNNTILGAFLCAIPPSLIAVGSLIRNARQQDNLEKEMQQGKLDVIQGLAVVDAGDTRFPATITVNEVKLKAPRDAILRVKHLEPHIFYYLPRSKVILSVEVVEQD